MYEMNKDLPYEQQVKLLLHHYDQLVVENKALKARIKEMEDEKAEYGDPKELREMLKTLPSKVKQLRELYNERDSRINWAKKKMVKYLRSKGVKLPPSINVSEKYSRLLLLGVTSILPCQQLVVNSQKFTSVCWILQNIEEG